jgi:iron complex transport system ATP-binding protein
MTAAAIATRDLSCRLGGRTVLDGVSLDIAAGGSVAILGPNGAGKTTLLKCIARIVRPASGAVEILGRPAAAYSQRELARVLSYVPQADARYLPFRVSEFVLLGRYPHLSPFSSLTPDDRRAADAAMDRTGTREFADRPIDTLSGGERQRVFIAAALAQGARILLLDEPATFLDYKHQVEVVDLLRGLNRDEGVTLVSVTHDANDAALLGDHAVALKAGRVHFAGDVSALLAEGVLESVFDTRFDRIAAPAGHVLVRAREAAR